MKKGIKITLIIIGVIVGIILLDTIQALVFNNNPIIGTQTKCRSKEGIFVTTYHCENGKNITKLKDSTCSTETVCEEADISKMEHIISVKSNDKIIDANTGSFCYMNTSGGSCIDKIDFQDFTYDVMKSYYNNKLFVENLDGTIKSIELFDYSSKKFIDTKVEFTNEYIVTPSISGPFIVKVNATYQGNNIEYYFMINISKTNGDEINLKITLKENSLSSVGLTMIVENTSDRDLEYGNPYSIEKYENGYWKSAPTINDLYFTMPAFGLKKGELKELNINWKYGYGNLKGKYRIVKDFSYKENDDYVSFNKYLEFEIK